MKLGSSRASASNMRVLIVDDDQNLAGAMRRVLEGEGYAVDLAFSGRAAIEKSKKAKFDAYLIDVRLPDMSGIEVLKALRATAERAVKIVISGYRMESDALDVLNEQADAYFSKPFDVKELLDALDTFTELRRTRYGGPA